jgi:hypothetical protein
MPVVAPLINRGGLADGFGEAVSAHWWGEAIDGFSFVGFGIRLLIAAVRFAHPDKEQKDQGGAERPHMPDPPDK